jgi:hypothetical protein
MMDGIKYKNAGLLNWLSEAQNNYYYATGKSRPWEAGGNIKK